MRSTERRRRRIELVVSRAAWNTSARRTAGVVLCFSFGLLAWMLVAGIPPQPWRILLVGGMVGTVLYLGCVLLRLIQAQTALDRFDNPRSGV